MRDVPVTGWFHGDGADLPLPNVILLQRKCMFERNAKVWVGFSFLS